MLEAKKLNFQAVIKSAASAASLDLQGSPRTTARHADDGARLGSHGSWSLIFGLPGGCASSRLDHGLNFFVNQGGCASSRLIIEFSDCVKPCSLRICQLSVVLLEMISINL